jgi:hypothetical protein
MKETFRKGKHDGYSIGESVLIHGHINNPSGWFITVRALSIYAEPLCGKHCTTNEIARYAKLKVNEKLLIADRILSEIHPHT